MQACKKCGTNNQEGVVFCGGCGAKFVPKKKISAKYIVSAVVILLVGAIALHFMFDSQGNQQPPQIAVVSAPKTKTSSAIARKVAAPVPQPTAQALPPCPNAIQAADYPNGITLSDMGMMCVAFTLNAGQKSPLMTVYANFGSAAGSPNGKPVCEMYPNGATRCANTGELRDAAQMGGNIFAVQASQDNTEVIIWGRDTAN